MQYNTNLSYSKYKKYDLMSLWKNLKDVSLWPSIEGYKERAEYSRKGLDWNTFENNVKHFDQVHINFFICDKYFFYLYNA